jgi:hypothetical protein
MSIAVIPTKANRIRAIAQANPGINPKDLAGRLGVDQVLVENALKRRRTFKPKSVAK